MSYKTILVPAIALAEDEAALAAAAAIAAKFEAKAAALVIRVHLSSEFADTAQPLSVVLEDIARIASSQRDAEHERIQAWLARAPHPFEVRDLTIESAAGQDRIVAHARVADLIIMARAKAHARARRALFEDILFKSGRPLMIVPETVREPRFDTILIGWNAGQQAVRAVIGALPLLRAARQVIIATVDASPRPAGHAEAPGRDLAAYLAHHGARVEVRNLDGMGRSDAKVLLDEALALAADLLVVGAYGHSRAQEFVFGGVTRQLLAEAPLSLLMAH
jgi:nucleotide-binding universal stress UspA family protein